MKLHFELEITDDGVWCTGSLTDVDPEISKAQINLMCVGALEAARSSLLAQRWGIDLNQLTAPPPLVKRRKKQKTADEEKK